jgi:hypothetical protein
MMPTILAAPLKWFCGLFPDCLQDSTRTAMVNTLTFFAFEGNLSPKDFYRESNIWKN